LPAALALLASGSCSLVQLYDGTRDGGGGAHGSGSGGGDAGVDAPSCPSDMVEIPNGMTSYCIDRLEVSNLAYAQFLAQVDAAAPKEPPGKCDWNVDYAPAVTVDAGADLPVLGVDWCDAYAYCAWANKRLCGTMGGGHISPLTRDTDHDEWYAACSQHANDVFPYGPAYDGTRCAVCDPDAGCDEDASPPNSAPVAVGSKKGCQGGYEGIFDMSGNAGEWEDACDDAGLEPDAGVPDPRYDVCYHRGGSFEYPRWNASAKDCLGCFSYNCGSSGNTRHYRPPDVGLRCCRAL
jgi:formylglycine-generating enzyme required for sulfatase activity